MRLGRIMMRFAELLLIVNINNIIFAFNIV